MPPPDDCYEPDSEELAYLHAQDAEFEALCEGHDAAERELRDYLRHTDRQLRDISKESKYLTRRLWQEYQFDVAGDFFDVSYDSKYYFTFPRRGAAHAPDTLTRKDKRRMRKRGRQAERLLGKRQLEILTKRGCSPRQVKGYEDRSFTPVVAAK